MHIHMRGQGSLEALTGVGFMLLLFSITLFLTFDRNAETENVREFLRNRTDCDAVALGVDAAFLSGRDTTILRNLANNASVHNSQLIIGDVFCLTVVNMTNGTHNIFSLVEGDIEIVALETEVRVRNV